jgi:hypothetical protein
VNCAPINFEQNLKLPLVIITPFYWDFHYEKFLASNIFLKSKILEYEVLFVKNFSIKYFSKIIDFGISTHGCEKILASNIFSKSKILEYEVMVVKKILASNIKSMGSEKIFGIKYKVNVCDKIFGIKYLPYLKLPLVIITPFYWDFLYEKFLASNIFPKSKILEYEVLVVKNF